MSKELNISTLTKKEFEDYSKDYEKRELLANAFEAYRVDKEKEIAELQLKTEQLRDPEKDAKLVRESLRASKWRTIYQCFQTLVSSPSTYVTICGIFVCLVALTACFTFSEDFWKYLTYISKEQR